MLCMARNPIMQINFKYTVKVDPNESVRAQLLDVSEYKLILLILIYIHEKTSRF